MRRLGVLLLVLALTACARNTPIDPAVLAPPSPIASVSTQPDHVTLPQDDAPHHDLTEWWYYTGHLFGPEGRTYGFELVFFQVERRDDPPGYAAHFAITDNYREDFHFQERSASGEQIHASAGLDLNLSGWTLQGGNGNDHLSADMPNYAMDLHLSAVKPPVLHDGKGLISFGAAGDSYYYSRTRMQIGGTLTDHGQPVQVNGTAWMDHQWGNFVSAGGGWDWFSIQLDDQSEFMLFFLRNPDGKPSVPYGTYVAPDGSATVLGPQSFPEQPTGSWQSRESGITYPSGWTVTAGDTTLSLTPTVKDQELRTAESTGITYWEGDVTITGTKAGQPITGLGYVELVGYH
ncbi:MAG TPA: lipocalin-like domain-containing protein [Chloroflexota bacterium]|nr:lipocalin-like domain-containing protein [Chloroflexota bacterium]